MTSYWVTVSTIYMTLPVYFEVTGFSKTEIGILLAIGTMSGAFSSLILGWLSDRIGRKVLLVFSLFSYAISFLLFYFFQGFSFFIITRLIEGIGAFSTPALSTAIIANISPLKKYGQAMGLYESVAGAGKIVGPLIAGLILTIGSFSAYFIFCSTFVFISAIIVLILLNESVARQNYAQSELKFNTKCTQLNSRESLIKNTLKPLVFFYIAIFLRSLGQTAVSPLLSLFVMERLGKSTMIEISMLFCIQGCMAMVLSPIAGKLSDKTGRKKPLFVATLLLSVATLFYIYCVSLVQIFIITLINGAASAFITPLTNAYLADLLTATGHSSLSGAWFGIAQFLSVQTFSFGSVFGGYVVDLFGYNELFLTASTFSLISLLPLVKVPAMCYK